MKAEEAATIARRIVNIWRATPSLAEWQDKLADYDYDEAIDTLRTLRDEQDGTLSIARFHATHRGRTSSTPTGPPDRCELCDGTGWVECLDERRHRSGCQQRDTCYCHAVTPCRCQER